MSLTLLLYCVYWPLVFHMTGCRNILSNFYAPPDVRFHRPFSVFSLKSTRWFQLSNSCQLPVLLMVSLWQWTPFRPRTLPHSEPWLDYSKGRNTSGVFGILFSLSRFCPYISTRWSRHSATNQKLARSIPVVVNGIFHWHNPCSRTTALGSTQPLTEMSARSISCG